MSEGQYAQHPAEAPPGDRGIGQLAEPVDHASKLAGIGRFANVIAHDFNNLLAVIRAYAELALRERTLDGGVREQLEAIRGAADSATWLAQQLLVHTRRNTGRASLLDLNLMLRDLHQLLGRSRPAGITSELRLQENLPPVFADPGPVGQVLLSAVAQVIGGLPAGGRLVIESFENARPQPPSTRSLAALPHFEVRVRISGTTVGAGAAGADAHGTQPRPRTASPAPVGADAIEADGDGLAAAAAVVRSLQGDISVSGDAHAGWAIEITFPGASAPPVPAVHSASVCALVPATEGRGT